MKQKLLVSLMLLAVACCTDGLVRYVHETYGEEHAAERAAAVDPHRDSDPRPAEPRHHDDCPVCSVLMAIVGDTLPAPASPALVIELEGFAVPLQYVWVCVEKPAFYCARGPPIST